jgi:hypothetical protein
MQDTVSEPLASQARTYPWTWLPIRHAGASSNEMKASDLRDIRMVEYAQLHGWALGI